MSEIVYDPESEKIIDINEYRLKRLENKLLEYLKKLVDDAIPIIGDYLANNYELYGKIDVRTGEVRIGLRKKTGGGGR